MSDKCYCGAPMNQHCGICGVPIITKKRMIDPLCAACLALVRNAKSIEVARFHL